MLKFMRDTFKHLKWVLVSIIAVFILSFVIADFAGSGVGAGNGQNLAFAARVNGETVSILDFNRALYFTEQRYGQMYGQAVTAEMRQMLGLRRQVLNSLVDELLILQEARRLNLAATPSEIRRRIAEIEPLYPDGQFVGPELYQRFVTVNLGYPTVGDFEADLGRQLTAMKLETALRASFVIPPGAVEAEYRRREQRATIRYALLPAGPLAEQIQVSADEVERYYRENSARYSAPEQRRITYLLADLDVMRQQAPVSEQDLRAFYDQNRESYRFGDRVRAQHILIRTEPDWDQQQVAAARARIQGLVGMAREGADFGELARQHSEDPGSAANDGDLGFFERGQMVPEFEQAAFSLEVNGISDPVQSQFGFHVIRLNERQPGGYRPFEEVRPEIEQVQQEEIVRSRARDRLAQARARLGQVRQVGDEEMRAQTDALVTYNTTPFFGRTDEIEGLGRMPQISTWAFSAREGELGQVIETPRGPVLPLLRQVRQPGIPPLDEIRNRVENELKMQRAREQGAQRLTAALQQSGNDLVAAAAAVGVGVEETTVTHTYVSGLSGDISPVIRAAMASQDGELHQPAIIDQGAIAFQTVEAPRFDREAFEAGREAVLESMQQTEVLRLRQALLARLREQSRIVVNERLMVENPAGGPMG
jgi:peptidyl-prolyl cis-trans isomerase D